MHNVHTAYLFWDRIYLSMYESETQVINTSAKLLDQGITKLTVPIIINYLAIASLKEPLFESWEGHIGRREAMIGGNFSISCSKKYMYITIC